MARPRARRGEVDPSPLPWRPRSKGAARCAAFCKRFIRVPKGTGALQPLVLRDWQIDLVGSVLDADAQPRIAGWCCPRGQGKSTLVAALGLYELLEGGEGATVVVVAVDERQAGIVFNIARRMIELSEELADRVHVYKDRLVVPSRGATFQCLPSTPAGLEGLDYTLGICDEIGVCDPLAWETLALAQGKRERSSLIGIGTPGVRQDNVLARLRAYAAEHPEDTSQVYREYSAAGFEHHPLDCDDHGNGPGSGCWSLANPALDDFLHRDALRALLPPKTTEGNYRRARLCQFVSVNENPLVTEEVWGSLCVPDPIPDGAEIVIALDGSWGGKNADATALVIGTVSATPQFDLFGLWESDGSHAFRVPVLEVENKIREAQTRWQVKELVADPFRWGRSLAVLSAEGLKVTEFPWSPSRLTRATTDLFSAASGGKFTHSGDERLTRHMLAASVIETNGGLRIGKTSRRRSALKVDAAAALLMCHSRCVWLGTRKTKPKRTASW
jgi:phage terminase large subunit-like protein